MAVTISVNGTVVPVDSWRVDHSADGSSTASLKTGPATRIRPHDRIAIDSGGARWVGTVVRVNASSWSQEVLAEDAATITMRGRPFMAHPQFEYGEAVRVEGGAECIVVYQHRAAQLVEVLEPESGDIFTVGFQYLERVE